MRNANCHELNGIAAGVRSLMREGVGRICEGARTLPQRDR
jgi:hypothetical protein